MLFLYAAYRIARGARDLYGRVVAGASATVIGFQAFLNMLCMVNLLPMTGKPLPFFSAGGSSIIVTLILVGLILNVSFRSNSWDDADRRRDDLLIIEGGRNAAQRQGSGAPSGWSRLGGWLHSQPAQPASPAVSASQLRKAPVNAPVRAPVNPMLRMSPARNRSNLSGGVGAGNRNSDMTPGAGVRSADNSRTTARSATAATRSATAVRPRNATTDRAAATTTARATIARSANPRDLNDRSSRARKGTPR
jgi:cell division protein FtsW